jgi:hypothetical protein
MSTVANQVRRLPLVVDPRRLDLAGRVGVDDVLVVRHLQEQSDGAEPAGDRRLRQRQSGEVLEVQRDVDLVDRERRREAELLAPGPEHLEVQLVGFARPRGAVGEEQQQGAVLSGKLPGGEHVARLARDDLCSVCGHGGAVLSLRFGWCRRGSGRCSRSGRALRSKSDVSQSGHLA